MNVEKNSVNEQSVLLEVINDFFNCINDNFFKRTDNESINNNQFFFVYQNGELLKQYLKNLLYIRADGSYSKLYIVENDIVKCIHITGNIRSIEKIITNKYLIRTHRSFIVNMLYAKSITKNRIFFENKFKEHYAKISQEGFKKISILYPIIGCKIQP